MEREWRAAVGPEGNRVRVRVQLADASRKGREAVASFGPPSVRQGQSPSVSRQSQSQPQGQRQPDGRQPPTASRHASSRLPATLRPPPVTSRGSAEERATVTFAEDEVNWAIARFQPFIRLAAVSATTRSPSPDHYGLGRHWASNARPARSPEA